MKSPPPFTTFLAERKWKSYSGVLLSVIGCSFSPSQALGRYCSGSYYPVLPRVCRLQRAPCFLGAGGDPGGGGVLEEPNVGDRADPTGHGRERLGHGRDTGEVQVAHEAFFPGVGVPPRVYSDVYGDDALTDVFLFNEPRYAGSHYQDVGLLRELRLAPCVVGVLVARDHGRVAQEPQGDGRLADVVGPPDEDHVAAGGELRRVPPRADKIPVEHVECGRRCGRYIAGTPERQQPRLHRVDRLYVLKRIERSVHGRLGDVVRQRLQDEDARYAGVRLQLPDGSYHLRLLGVDREPLAGVAVPQLA